MRRAQFSEGTSLVANKENDNTHALLTRDEVNMGWEWAGVAFIWTESKAIKNAQKSNSKGKIKPSWLSKAWSIIVPCHVPCTIFKENLTRFLMDKYFKWWIKIFRYTPYILYFRSVTFVFLILAFNTFYFLRRTSLKTTYLRDGRFLLKDCLLLLLLLLLL